MPIYEITGFNEGISKEGVTFLQPSQSFSELKDGFVYRQVLQSRLGFNEFATGGAGDYNLISSLGLKPAETLIEDEVVDTTDGSAAYSFTLANPPIRESYMTVSSASDGKTITCRYDGSSWVFTGDYDSGGTNTINATTGAVTITFDAAVSGGNNITATYTALADQSVTPAASTTQSFTLDDDHIVRKTVVVTGTIAGPSRVKL